MGFINFDEATPTKGKSIVFGNNDFTNSEAREKKQLAGDFIKFPQIKQELEEVNKPYFEEQALEAGIIVPFTPQWRALEIAGNKAGATIGKLAGSIMDLSRTKGVPNYAVNLIKSGTDEDLEVYLKNIDDIINNKSSLYGDELLGVPKLGGVSDNFFERSRYFDTRGPRIGAQVRKDTKELVSGVPELQDDVVGAVQKSYKSMDDKVSEAYQKVEDVGDDTIRYDVTDMREGLLKNLRDEGYPEPVIRNIKRNLFYIERNLTPAERGAQNALPKLDDAFQESAAELTAMFPKGVDGRKNLLTEAMDKADQLRTIKPANRDMSLSDLNSAIGKYKKAKDSMDTMEAVLPDFNEVGEKEFIRLIKEINRKKHIGGGEMGKYDMLEQKGLTYAKRHIENYFEKATESTNPEIAPLFKEARKTYAEKVRRFGHQQRGNDNFPELGKMVEKKYVDGQEIDNTAQLESILKSPAKIKTVGKILDEETPGTTTKMAEEWLYNKLGVIRQGDKGLLDMNKADLPSLQGQLDDIVSDERAMGFIHDTLGPEKVTNLKALHNIVSSLKTFTKSLGKESGDTKSWTDYIDEGTGLISKTGRTFKIIKDYIQDTGSAGNYSTDVMNRTAELIKRVQGSKTASNKSMAEKELRDFVEEFMSGSIDGVKGGIGATPAIMQAPFTSGEPNIVEPKDSQPSFGVETIRGYFNNLLGVTNGNN